MPFELTEPLPLSLRRKRVYWHINQWHKSPKIPPSHTFKIKCASRRFCFNSKWNPREQSIVNKVKCNPNRILFIKMIDTELKLELNYLEIEGNVLIINSKLSKCLDTGIEFAKLLGKQSSKKLWLNFQWLWNSRDQVQSKLFLIFTSKLKILFK